MEGASLPREICQVMIGSGVGVRPAHRVVLAALPDPPESHLVGNHAVHDTQTRETAERFQAWPPHVVLERGVSDGRDASAQQQLHDTEENRQGPRRQLIPWCRRDPGLEWAMPSLISSRQIAGHPTARASRCASVVLPAPAGPLTTTRVGRDTTLTVIATITQPVDGRRKSNENIRDRAA